MWTRGMRSFAALGVLVALACVFAGSRLIKAARADDDASASLIGSWRGTRRVPGTIAVRHNLLSFLPGGVAHRSGAVGICDGREFRERLVCRNGIYRDVGQRRAWKFCGALDCESVGFAGEQGNSDRNGKSDVSISYREWKKWEGIKGNAGRRFSGHGGEHAGADARGAYLGCRAADDHIEWI